MARSSQPYVGITYASPPAPHHISYGPGARRAQRDVRRGLLDPADADRAARQAAAERAVAAAEEEEEEEEWRQQWLKRSR